MSAAALREKLDAILEPVLSMRRTATPLAEALARIPPEQQVFVIHWATVISRTNAELAFQFAAAAPDILRALHGDIDVAERCVLEAMDVYDREGLHAACVALREAPERVRTTAQTAVELTEVRGVLQHFVNALHGRPLRIAAAPQASTDTETLYLPVRMARGASRSENFLLYKASAAMLWAQTRFGTFNVDLETACARFDDPARALTLASALETLRLEGRIADELPGLYREISTRREVVTDRRCERLRARGATVHDTLDVLREIYDAPPRFADYYRTLIDPRLAAEVRAKRIVRERTAFRQALSEAQASDEESIAYLVQQPGERRNIGAAVEIIIEAQGQSLALSGELEALACSIVQDLGTIPDDYLARRHEALSPPEDVAPADMPEGERFVYDEWDCFRKHYRKAWCTVRELDVEPASDECARELLAPHANRIRSLKRSFELMRDEPRILRKQPEGDALDFEAFVEAYADASRGAELSPLVFTRRHRTERDLAAVLMIDMSGSTKGWINDAEREALLMLCEALEALGDAYAIYGFSGLTRHRCEVFRVKDFTEPYGAEIRRRIAGIEAQDYTRMGAAIRHVTRKLDAAPARTKLLITLSDGKPDDYSDAYRGEYGIEDTRQALLEAHRRGVRPFCITIDREARDYLPHMYGAVNWALVEDVAQLPARVAAIYQKLTR